MLLIWSVRYRTAGDEKFASKLLVLSTETLDPPTRSAVEAAHQLRSLNSRSMMPFRNLFRANTTSDAELARLCEQFAETSTFCIPDYFENEDGTEMTGSQFAVAVTGRADAVLLPPGSKEHDVEFYRANKVPIDVTSFTISGRELGILAHFVRDLEELKRTVFFQEGPGRLTWQQGDPTQQASSAKLHTAANEEEIRSFVMVFRRLYIHREDANFQKATKVIGHYLRAHPFSVWLEKSASQLRTLETERPEAFPLGRNLSPAFTRKRLFDGFLYTQYLHQPKPDASQIYADCLAEVNGAIPVLTYMFMSEMHHCAIAIVNIGNYVAQFFNNYICVNNVSPNSIPSISQHNPGIGQLESRAKAEARIIDEKARELAIQLWINAGQPGGGSEAFVDAARFQILQSLGGAS